MYDRVNTLITKSAEADSQKLPSNQLDKMLALAMGQSSENKIKSVD